MKHFLFLLLTLFFSGTFIQAATFRDYFNTGGEYDPDTPTVYIRFGYFHPDFISSNRIQVGEGPVYPVGYVLRKGTHEFKEIEFVFNFNHRHGRFSRSFKKSPEARIDLGNLGDVSFKLLNSDEKPSVKNVRYLEITSEKKGRMRYKANAEDIATFGRLVEWEKPDGSLVTPETYEFERILDDKGGLKQFRNYRLLLHIEDMEDGGIMWSFYDVKDVYRKEGSKEYSIREGAAPVKSTRFSYPRKNDHHLLRMVNRINGKTDYIIDIRLAKMQGFISHFTEYPPEDFWKLDPGGAEEVPERISSPLAWVQNNEKGDEVGKRFSSLHGEDYFTHLINRVKKRDDFQAGILQYGSDPEQPSSYGKEIVRASDGSFRRWRVTTYDARGRVEAVFDSIRGASEGAPSTDLDILEKRSDRITVKYTSATGTEIAELTHWINGTFISRTWIQPHNSLLTPEEVVIERTEDASHRIGNTENFRETRPPEDDDILMLDLWK